MKEQVTIPRAEYESLLSMRDWLSCLVAAGVDNWDGYSFAHEISRQRGYTSDEDDE